jgi:hypothetical protein
VVAVDLGKTKRLEQQQQQQRERTRQ